MYNRMGWLRLVGSLELQVSFAEYRLFYRTLLQKRPTIVNFKEPTNRSHPISLPFCSAEPVCLCDMTHMCGMVHMCDMTHMCDVTHMCDMTYICDVTHITICDVTHMCDMTHTCDIWNGFGW